MKETGRRILSVILAIVMCFSLLPTSSFAQEESVPDAMTAEQTLENSGEGIEAEFTEEEEAQSSEETLAGEELDAFVRVVFQTEPENADVIVYYDDKEDDEEAEEKDSELKKVDPEKDGSYLLLPGDYLYDVTADGRVPVEKAELKVELPKNSGEIQEIQIILEAVSADAEPTETSEAEGENGEVEIAGISVADEQTSESSTGSEADGQGDRNSPEDDLTAEELEELAAELAKELRIDREYLAITLDDEEVQEIQLNLLGIPERLSNLVSVYWDVADSNMQPWTEDDVISVDQDGVITPLNKGTGYVMATVSLGETTCTARCRVDVSEKPVSETVTGVSLVSSKATVELYKTDYTRIPIVLSLPQNISAQSDGEPEDSESESADSGIAIIGAAFTQEPMKSYFRLRVADDRTLEIIPQNAFAVDSKGKITTSLTKSSYQSAIRVMGEGWETTTAPLTVTIKKTLPKVKASVGKFNTFVPGETREIAFSPVQAKVLSVDLGTLTWLAYDAENECLKLTENANALQKAVKGKITVKVNVDGWDQSVVQTVSVNVSAARTAPKLTFKPSSLTLNPAAGDEVETTVAVSLAEYADAPVILEKITLNNTTYTGGDLICSPEAEEHVIKVKTGSGFDSETARSFKVYYSIAGESYYFTVKTLAASKAKPSFSVKAAGAIDTSIPGSPVTLTVTPKNYLSADYSVTFKRYDAKNKAEPETDVSSNLFVQKWDGNQLVIRENPGQGLTAGTYRVYLTATVAGEELTKFAAITVKSSDPAKVAPSVTLKASGKLDVIRPASSIVLTPTMKNWYGHELSADDLIFYKGTGKSAVEITEAEEIPFAVKPVEPGEKTFTLTLKESINYKTEKYSVGMRDRSVEGSRALTKTPLTLTVTMGSVKLTQSTKSVELLRYDRFSNADLVIGTTDGTLAEIDHIDLVENNTSLPFAVDMIDGSTFAVHWRGDEVTVPAKTRSAKLTLKVFLKGNPSLLAKDANATLKLTVNISDTETETEVDKIEDFRNVTIECTPNEAGTARCTDQQGNEITRQKVGRKVQVVPTAADGYEVERVSYKEDGAVEWSLLESPYLYTMQETDVTFLVVFREKLAGIVASGVCGQNLIWTLDENGTLTISGTGKMDDYETAEDRPWAEYSNNGSTVIRKLVVNEGVTGIGDRAFCNCYNLNEISLPDGLKTVGISAFETCITLTGVSLPDSITTLGEKAFYCGNVKTINYPLSLNEIRTEREPEHSTSHAGYYTSPFAGTQVTRITIPAGVTKIPDFAFAHMTSLKTVSFPATLTEMGWEAFFDCPQLTSANLSATKLEELPGWAFGHCTSLRTVTLRNGLKEIGDSAFSYCTSLTTLTLPDSVNVIHGIPIFGCSSLSRTNFPQNVRDLSGWISDCPLIVSLSVPEGVTTIPAYAFNGLHLESIYLPATLQTIEDGAFPGAYSDYTGVSDVYFAGSEEEWSQLEIGYFNEGLDGAVIHYNHDNKEADIAAAGTCGESLTWTFYSTGELVVTGEGPMNDYDFPTNPEPWYNLATRINKVTIGDGVTSIGSYAFRSAIGMKTVELPNSLVSIGEGAFRMCLGLKTVYYSGTEQEWEALVENIAQNNDYLLNANVIFSYSAPVFHAQFNVPDNRKTLVQGESWIIDADVSVTGGTGYLGRVTVNAEYYSGSTMTDDYTGHFFDEVELKYWAAYTIDTTQAPWNVPGTYNIRIWAKDTDGVGGDRPLASMTLTVIETSGFTGEVRSENGLPLRDVQINVCDENGYLASSAVSGSDGTWNAPNLYPGRNYVVSCDYPPFRFDNAAATADVDWVTVPTFVGVPEGAYLNTDLVAVRAGKEENTKLLTVNASQDWEAACSDEWITLNKEANTQLQIGLTYNEGEVRIGRIQISCGELTTEIPVVQEGEANYRLADPIILDPQTDNTVIPFGEVRVEWTPVENAEYYVISLRDLSTDELLINHFAMANSSCTTILSPEYFFEGRDYRIAVGAVPPGMPSTDRTVGWSERLFSVPAEEIPDENSLIGRICEEVYTTVETDDEGNIVSETKHNEPLPDTTVNLYKEVEGGFELIGSVVTGEDGKFGFEEIEAGVIYHIELESEIATFSTQTIEAEDAQLEEENSIASITSTNVSNSIDSAYQRETVPGINNIGDITGAVNANESMQQKLQREIAGRPNGLWAEFFQYKDLDSWDSPENKRWELGVTESGREYPVSQQYYTPVKEINFQWVKETSDKLEYLVPKDFDGNRVNGSQLYLLKKDKMAIRFNGYVVIPETGKYQFKLQGDDGSSFELKYYKADNKCRDLGEDRFKNNGSNVETVGKTEMLEQGTILPITINYHNKGGNVAKLKFVYRFNNGTEQIVPSSMLVMGRRTVSIKRLPISTPVDVRSRLDEAKNEAIKATDQVIEGFCDDIFSDTVGAWLSPSQEYERNEFNSWGQYAATKLYKDFCDEALNTMAEVLIDEAFDEDQYNTPQKVFELLLDKCTYFKVANNDHTGTFKNIEFKKDSFKKDAIGTVVKMIFVVMKSDNSPYPEMKRRLNEVALFENMDPSASELTLSNNIAKWITGQTKAEKLMKYMKENYESATKLTDVKQMKSYCCLLYFEDFDKYVRWNGGWDEAVTVSAFPYYPMFNTQAAYNGKEVTLIGNYNSASGWVNKRNLVEVVVTHGDSEFEKWYKSSVNIDGEYLFAKELLVDTIKLSKMVIKDAIG